MPSKNKAGGKDLKAAAPTLQSPSAARAGATTLLYPIADTKLAGATKVFLGKVPLDAERVTWAFTPGPSAFTFSFEVWENIHAQLSRLGRGPHKLEITCPGLSGDKRLTVSGVYLIDYRPGDERAVSWRIGDRRYWLDYSKYTGRHNLRRRVNDVVGLDPDDVYGYNIERYRPYSTIKAWTKDGEETVGPQTALGLARRILDVCDKDGVTSETFADVEDNGVPVESKQYLEDRPSSALGELCRLAEVGFYVDLNSKYKFYDLRTDLFQSRAAREAGWLRGRFMEQKNYRTRPSKVRVSFLQEQEVEAVTEDAHPTPNMDVYTRNGAKTTFEKLADKAGLKILQIAGARKADRQNDNQGAQPQAPGGAGGTTAIPLPFGGSIKIPGAGILAGAVANLQAKKQQALAQAQKGLVAAIAQGAAVNQQIPKLNEPILLENVLQIPRTIEVQVTDDQGRTITLEFTRGEFVRVDVALAAWQVLDTQANASPLVPLNEANLRKYWFGNVIGRIYCFDTSFPTWVDPVKLERISALRASYRRVWRITKPYLDNIHNVRAERVTIVDPVTRTQALPFVSTQYCEVPNLRPPARTPNKAARVVATNKDDYTNGVQSPMTFNVTNDLGILRVDPYPDMTQVNLVRERIIGLVDNIPDYDLNPDGSILWQKASLAAEFKMKVVLSVQWGAPNDKNVLYTIERDVADQGGRAGLLEIFSSIDSARVDKDGVVVNEGLLQRAADYEAQQIMFTHRDVGIGWAHFHGFRTNLAPTGNCRAVQFICENGVPYTLYDATEAYSQRPAEAAMDKATRDFVMRITEIG